MWKCFEEFEFRLVVGASLPHWLVFVSEQVGGLSRLSAGWGKCCVCCNERGYGYLELCRRLSVCLPRSILILKGLWEGGHHEFGEAAQLLSGTLSSSSALSTLC
jgi:hypothetical protein